MGQKCMVLLPTSPVNGPRPTGFTEKNFFQKANPDLTLNRKFDIIIKSHKAAMVL